MSEKPGAGVTLFPNALLDHAMAGLSGAEFKVLAYIVRRSLGLGQEGAALSLARICAGVRTADGAALDEGTGLAKKTAIVALRGLERKGLIAVRRPARGGAPPTVSVRWRPGADDPPSRKQEGG
ncbi:MAG TPA: hypothetical protein VFE42_20790 [Chloroflexota bacterium]|nr:hypothetical protein [Chloroflexota bacterium]HZS89916.1 hypothetical protein [Chloroflexota bacterium]